MRMFPLLRALSALCLPLIASTASAAPKPKSYIVYIGTYTDSTASKGIYAYRFDVSTGTLTSLDTTAQTKNPSFLAADRAGRFLYAVNEIGDYEGKSAGSVTSFAMDRTTGKLTALNTVSTKGDGPCHLMVDNTGKMLVVANYGGGSVASFPIGADGKLGEAAYFDQHTGKGANPARQDGPHAHSAVISPNNRFAFVADLGLDKIFSYRLEPSTGKMSPNNPPTASVAPGAGPRHFAIHPNRRWAYAIDEILSTITAFRYDNNRGTLREFQTITTLPADFHGENTTAEIVIHPNGKFVYGSNRGNDSIAVYSVDRNSGKLTLVEHVPTQGKSPRNFAIDPTGHYLLAANQLSGNIVQFQVDAKTGKLTPTGATLAIPAPVCVIFVPMK
jgi:6-phosphogluconolactonase